MNVALRRAFVTGGSGFVGRYLIAMLRGRGDVVRALARTDTAIKTVQRLDAESVHGDLDHAEALRNGMSGCDVVFHSAAKVEDWGRYEDFYRANVIGTENVLQAARASGVRKFVHVSTEAVLAGGPPIRNADTSSNVCARFRNHLAWTPSQQSPAHYQNRGLSHRRRRHRQRRQSPSRIGLCWQGVD